MINMFEYFVVNVYSLAWNSNYGKIFAVFNLKDGHNNPPTLKGIS